jgi:uncharacterized protein involved in response to NO
MELVRRDEVRPAAPATDRHAAEPYRLLFPVGILAAVAGLAPWVVYALSLAPWWPAGAAVPWPGAAHAALLVQGFESAFVCGFLLTAMPAFTHGPRCRVAEWGVVVAAIAGFAVLRALDSPFAPLAWLAALGGTVVAVGRRVRFGAAAPPEEFLLVATGLALGLAGGVAQGLAALGAAPPVAGVVGLRAVSLGMLPALVLGLGGLLVPTFSLMRDPLAIAGIARAGDRPRRRAFVLAIAALLVGALAVEAAGHDRLGGALRAGAALASTQLAWKLWRLPGRRDRLSWCLWAAGWCVTLGFMAAAAFPAHRLEGWHVAFVGGFALLTLAIGTRVVVSHGGHPMAEEPRVLSGLAVTALAAAALLRALGPLLDPQRAVFHHFGAAALALVALTAWLAGAWPRLRRTRPAMVGLVAPPPSSGVRR